MTTPLPLALPNRPRSPWTRELRRRFVDHVALKTAGICVFMTVFFALYFQLLRHPSRPPAVMPLTAFDDWVGFRPEAFWIYASLWLYVGIAPGLAATLRQVLGHGVWMAALCLVGLGCFWLWPTAVPARPVDLTQPGFTLLAGVDAAGNACPSLHVACAVLSAVWIDALLRGVGAPAPMRALNLAWVAAIAWSTLAVRQHVVLDALAGAALGLVFGGFWHAAAGRARRGEPVSSSR